MTTKKTGKKQEFSGDTVEAAISSAEKFFNVSRETLDIKVVSEESRGLFGMGGAEKAKIRAGKKEKG